MPGRIWTADSIPDLHGRTAVVTGANSGLGLATTHALARRGAAVVLAVRDEAKGRRAAETIIDEQPDACLEVHPLDLADLDSVAAFAADMHARMRERGLGVDVLINNAGVMGPPRTLNRQGQEVQFASNHLGHFALTGLLLDLLQGGDDPRVVTVTSDLHRGAHIDFDDLNGARRYAPMGFYRQSKFANVVFGLELHRRLRAVGSPVRSLLAHPGFSATNLQTSGPTGLLRTFVSLSSRVVGQDPAMGALPQLYAATAPSVEGGQLYGPDGFRELRGHPTIVRAYPAAEDRETARRLWQLSEDLTGVTYPFA